MSVASARESSQYQQIDFKLELAEKRFQQLDQLLEKGRLNVSNAGYSLFNEIDEMIQTVAATVLTNSAMDQQLREWCDKSTGRLNALKGQTIELIGGLIDRMVKGETNPDLERQREKLQTIKSIVDSYLRECDEDSLPKWHEQESKVTTRLNLLSREIPSASIEAEPVAEQSAPSQLPCQRYVLVHNPDNQNPYTFAEVVGVGIETGTGNRFYETRSLPYRDAEGHLVFHQELIKGEDVAVISVAGEISLTDILGVEAFAEFHDLVKRVNALVAEIQCDTLIELPAGLIREERPCTTLAEQADGIRGELSVVSISLERFVNLNGVLVQLINHAVEYAKTHYPTKQFTFPTREEEVYEGKIADIDELFIAPLLKKIQEQVNHVVNSLSTSSD